MLSNNHIVPVVMFHSVGLEKQSWIFAGISEPLECFEEKISMLVDDGYRFIFWNELFAHMSGTKPPLYRSIMLTFDDGYLDNWVYVYPILKKYDVKATIFVNPEFVDPLTIKRPTMEDVDSGAVAISDLKTKGFLNWVEMREMEASGLIDIQSHALTHTWYFSAPELVDFQYPGDPSYPWLAWNAHPDKKPYYMIEDQTKILPLGTPVYKHRKALTTKIFFPPEKISEGISGYINANGGELFFQNEAWKEILNKIHDDLMKKYAGNARLETKEEYNTRIFNELRMSRKIIEKRLEKQVKYICWPGGGYNKTVLQLAREAGYHSWTLASRDISAFKNRPGADPQQIKRISSFSRYTLPGQEPLGHAGGHYFRCGIERHKGSALHKWLGRAILLQKIFQ